MPTLAIFQLYRGVLTFLNTHYIILIYLELSSKQHMYNCNKWN